MVSLVRCFGNKGLRVQILHSKIVYRRSSSDSVNRQIKQTVEIVDEK